MVPFERALVSFYRPSIVTFHLSSCVSEILPLLFSSMTLFPTPPLVSSKFPHVPLGIGVSAFGCKSQDVGLIDRVISFQDFQPVITNHQRHGRTDRRTDDMRSQDRALH